MDSLPIMNDLDCKLTTEKFSKANGMMAPWKAPGSDSIPANLLRICKSCLLPHLQYDVREESMVPRDIRETMIITLFKNKGSRSDCNNYSEFIFS